MSDSGWKMIHLTHMSKSSFGLSFMFSCSPTCQCRHNPSENITLSAQELLAKPTMSDQPTCWRFLAAVLANSSRIASEFSYLFGPKCWWMGRDWSIDHSDTAPLHQKVSGEFLSVGTQPSLPGNCTFHQTPAAWLLAEQVGLTLGTDHWLTLLIFTAPYIEFNMCPTPTPPLYVPHGS